MRDAGDRRRALVEVGGAARGLGAAVLGYASSGLPGPKGNLETFVWLAEAARGGGLTSSGPRARSSLESGPDGDGADPPPAVGDAPGGRGELIEVARERRRGPLRRRRGDAQAPARARDRGRGRRRRAARRRHLLRARRRRDDPDRAAQVRRDRRRGVRGELRRDRVPGHRRPRRGANGVRAGVRGRLRGAVAAGDRAVGAREASGWRSTTSRSTASPATASPISRTRSGRTRSGGFAATAWRWPRRRDRPATTSPTAAR